MANVLVTGGAGFIGSHVAEQLIKNGHKVVIIDDLSGGFIENIPSETKFYQASINNSRLLSTLFEEYKFEYVFHLAAYAAEGLSHFIRNFNYTNNLVGTVNPINESVKHDIKCFVFTSSIAVYGHAKPPVDEDTIPSPVDPYGIAKYATELDLKAAYDMFGLNSVIFRPHNVYGERQNIGDKYRNVIGIFMNNMLKGESVKVFGDGEQRRAFSHIDYVAKSIASVCEKPETYNQIYNIGDDKDYSINELVSYLEKASNTEIKKEHVEARNEVGVIYADHSKAKDMFGEGNVDLEEGIRRMYKWVESHGIMQPTKAPPIEVYKNLPKSWL